MNISILFGMIISISFEMIAVRSGVPPTVSLEPQQITIPIGTTGTLRCNVTGEPEPVVTWRRSRGKLAANQVNGNVLRITDATMADRGIYECQAENAAGLDQDWAIVNIEQ